MLRRLFTFAAAVSLLLFMSSAGLWVRSYFGDGGGWHWNAMGKKFELGMSGGTADADFRPSAWSHFTFTNVHRVAGITFFTGAPNALGMFFPLWIPTTLFSLLPISWAVSSYFRRRARAGCCLTCSYDLTGNISGICPECGTRIDRSSAAISN